MFILRRGNIKICRAYRQGFTIIEALVLLSIFLIVTVSFYRVFSSGSYLTLEAKKRLMAVSVANERMEYIRSLSYEEIGTISGTPEGDIDSDEYVTSGVHQFHLTTSITYADDSYDGTGGDDVTTNDYKNVLITALWGSEADNQSVSISSIVAPFGEEVGIEGGTLSINVLDINGSPVEGAMVNIFNSDVFPSINQNVTTNSSGNASVIGLPEDEEGYIVTVTKSGYDSVATMDPYPVSAYYPTNVHASVIDGQTTNSVMESSELSDIQIKFEDAYSGNVSSVDFDLVGGKVLGTEESGGLVYNYSESLTSDSAGVENVSDISPGQYIITINETGYTFWKTDSGTGNNADEIIVSSGESSQTKSVQLLDESRGSYFLKVVDFDTSVPIEGATVELSNAILSYSDSQDTDEYGYVYFPNSPDALVDGETYDITINASGYSQKNSTVDISQLTEEEIGIDPS